MSLRPDPIGPVPADTARAVRAAFRKGNLYVRLREELGTIYEDDVFADVFSHTGQPAEARLSLSSGVCCNMWRISQIDKPLMRSGPGWIGNTYSASN